MYMTLSENQPLTPALQQYSLKSFLLDSVSNTTYKPSDQEIGVETVEQFDNADV